MDWGGQYTNQKKQTFLVILNNKFYSGAYLNQTVLPNQQLIKQMDIIHDKSIISKYTSDPEIEKIISIRTHHKQARSIYLRLKEKGIFEKTSG